MTTIYLIRHGEKEATDSDPALTSKGETQAKKTGLFLKSFPISKILTSPKRRTQQTAENIASVLSLPFFTDPRLIERMDFGEGKHVDRNDFFTEWTKASLDRFFIPRAGNSSFETGKRIQSVIEEQDDDQHIAIVTHGGAIADFLRNSIGDDVIRPIMFEFPEGKDFKVQECSVTIVQRTGDIYSLQKLHCTDHLN